jgi:hypothetical protein
MAYGQKKGEFIMKAYPACIPCLFKQAQNTLSATTDEIKLHEDVYRDLAESIKNISLNDTPAGVSYIVYETIRNKTRISDPFSRQKKSTNELAQRLVPSMKEMISKSNDPLKSAIHIAAAGNIIDLGITKPENIEDEIQDILAKPFAIDDYNDFKKELSGNKTLLYISDNAGEIVFDRLLADELLRHNLKIYFSVKSGPIINDATIEDAEFAGLQNVSHIITTGSDDIGVNWSRCSGEFRGIFDSSDIVISKGQGNFETVTERRGNVYYLLKAKCECVAEELSVKLGDIVFKHRDTRHA